MIPIRDLQPTRSRPLLTYTLIALNVLIFLWQSTLDPFDLRRTLYHNAVIPVLINRDPFSVESILDILRSMFMHGGWLHLGANMLYLWIFGGTIEDRFGKGLFLIAYLGSGFAATATHILITPESVVPLVGASGAIAGVLGSYFVLYPKNRILCFVFLGFFVTFWPIRAVWVLGFWFVSQLFSGIASLGQPVESSIAFFAHIGGFLMGIAYGLVAARYLPAPEPDPMTSQPGQRPQHPVFDDSYLIQHHQYQPPYDTPPMQRERLLNLLRRRRQTPVFVMTDKGAYAGLVVSLSLTTVTIYDYRHKRVFTLPLDSIVDIQ